MATGNYRPRKFRPANVPQGRKVWQDVRPPIGAAILRPAIGPELYQSGGPFRLQSCKRFRRGRTEIARQRQLDWFSRDFHFESLGMLTVILVVSAALALVVIEQL